MNVSCPVCAGSALRDFLTLERVPVFCNQLCATREEALHVPMAPLCLAICEDCGHVHNTVFEPERVAYSPEYENSLHGSALFRDYVDRLVEDLAERHRLRDRTVVEIGCGRGEFLNRLCRHTGARGVGFDPGYPGASGVPDAETGTTIYRQAYDESVFAMHADLICSRHCLEHIARPAAFIGHLRRTLASDTPVFFEVPDVRHTLCRGGIWDLIYEHCGYFSAESLHRLFSRCGFRVDAVVSTYGGQFLTLQGRASPDRSTPDLVEEAGGSHGDIPALLDHVQGFARYYRSRIDDWQARLDEAAAAGRTLAVWGAGSKGTMFLNLLRTGAAVDCVVDINPRKQGRHVPGCGLPIVAPGELARHRPEAIVVMNPLYVDEIRALVSEVLPGIEILNP